VAKIKKIISYNIIASKFLFGYIKYYEYIFGLMINDYYKTNHKFNNNLRTLLVNNIINYIITKKTSIFVGLANSIAVHIVDIFPTHKSYYFYLLLYLFYFTRIF